MKKETKQFCFWALVWALGCWLLYVWLSTSVKDAEIEHGGTWENLTYIVTNMVFRTAHGTNVVESTYKTE